MDPRIRAGGVRLGGSVAGIRPDWAAYCRRVRHGPQRLHSWRERLGYPIKVVGHGPPPKGASLSSSYARPWSPGWCGPRHQDSYPGDRCLPRARRAQSAPGRKSSGKAKTGPTHTGTEVLKDLHLPTLQRCTTFGEKHIVLIADLLAAGCKPIEVAQLISGQHSRQIASNVWVVATAIRYGRSWSRHPNHDRIHAVVEMATKEGTLGKVDWIRLSRLTQGMDAK